MKVGFLLGNVKFGGGEKVLQTIIDEIHFLGHEIFIYSWNLDWLSQKLILPYNIIVLNNPPVGLGGKFKSFKELHQTLKGNPPDCLIIFSLALAEVGVFSARFADIPVLLSERVDPRYLPKSKIHRILKKVAFSFADKIVFQTEEVKNYFSKRIQRNGVVIQNMVMDENIHIKRNELFKKEIIAAGRLSEEKNYPMLIKGFALANLSDYKLRILGEGPEFKNLSTLILDLDLKDRVTLEGFVPDVKQYFINADIFVITSNHEGMPNALIEAMATGMACVSTDFSSGGAKALIEDGVNGILINVNDVQSLKTALLYLILNPAIKNQIKLNATEIRIKNSKKEIMPLWVELIKSMRT